MHGADDDVIEIELHGFSDASTKAYAALKYLRLETKNDVLTNLVAAKTRPLNDKNIPRLELLACFILSNPYNSGYWIVTEYT